jgi:cyclase
MFRHRTIPVLLVSNGALVKTLRFREPIYLGDPLNAVKIFGEMEADELVLLGIQGQPIPMELLLDVAAEATMPLAVGGGIRKLSQIAEVISAGAERVVIGTEAVVQQDFVRRAVAEFGSSTIAVCLDVAPGRSGEQRVWHSGGTQETELEPVQLAKRLEEQGVGEIIVQSISRDGSMVGYDMELLRLVSDAVTVPVVALGGAGCAADLAAAQDEANVAAAAGSMFVFHRKRGAVLISYPSTRDRKV